MKVDEETAENENSPNDLEPDPKVWFSSNKPPLYDFIYIVVVCLCVSGLTWLFRSGALQLWDRILCRVRIMSMDGSFLYCLRFRRGFSWAH